MEDRQPCQATLLLRREQVPRPADHRAQGLVPGRCGPVAATEQREPVAERAAHVLGGSMVLIRAAAQLDGEWQTVEPLHDVGHDARREVRLRPGGPRPAYEDCATVGEGSWLRLNTRSDPRAPHDGSGEHPARGARPDADRLAAGAARRRRARPLALAEARYAVAGGDAAALAARQPCPCSPR